MSNDPYDLERFVGAQQADYGRALSEIRSGEKRTHWMWYVFPQLLGLGNSPNAVRYAIRDLGEAEAYWPHPLLGPRLVECADAVLQHEGRTAAEIFGYPDDVKLRSSATLFAAVSPADSPFHRIIDTLFQGHPDEKTLRLLSHAVRR